MFFPKLVMRTLCIHTGEDTDHVEVVIYIIRK